MTPGPLIGRGRAADVFDVGAGRVLRRYRLAPSSSGLVQREAAVMRHLAAHGFPVPAVHDASELDLVMDRLDGVTMLDELGRRPWRMRRHVATWADLHRRLAAVPVGELATAGVPARFGPPTAMLHLDFHPDNIMLTADGPVVFDWTNAALGPSAADVAMSWVLGAMSDIDGGRLVQTLSKLVRRRLIDRFVDLCGRTEAVEVLPVVAAQRLLDPNVRPAEAARIHALVAAQR